MRFRVVVLAGCFCLALLGTASGASAQSALPNGYTIPEAFAFDVRGDTAYPNGNSRLYLARYTAFDSFCEGNPVASIDPATGAVTCGPALQSDDLACWLGSLKVEVVAGGKRASFTGRKDCALRPMGCLRSGKVVTLKDCSNGGKAQTAAIYVKSCSDGDYLEGYCIGIRHTAANAKKRRFSTVASWKVSFNGKSIGAGRMRLTTTYTPAVKGTKGKRIYSDTNFDSYYNYCLDDPWPKTYSSNGRIYCWYPGTPGRKAKWTDKGIYLSGPSLGE